MTNKEGKKDNIRNRPTNDLDGKLIHVKVGGDDWSKDMLDNEINKVRDSLGSFLKENNIDCYLIVTHKFIDINIIEPLKKIKHEGYALDDK